MLYFFSGSYSRLFDFLAIFHIAGWYVSNLTLGGRWPSVKLETYRPGTVIIASIPGRSQEGLGSRLIISTVVLIRVGSKTAKSPLWISPKTQDRAILSLYICWPYHLWHLCEIWTELNIVWKSYKNSKTTKTTSFVILLLTFFREIM